MIDERLILKATIDDFQNRERIRRVDSTFDGWSYLAKKIGLKSATHLRKMTEPKGEGNNAKFGYVESLIIMDETDDYRLLQYAHKDLVRRKKDRQEQLTQITMFDEPLRTLENIQ